MRAFTEVLNPQHGWYRGDLHAHTTCSDGVLSPAELVDLARQEQLDFLAITDHNTIGAFSELSDPQSIALIPGSEITLDVGHFNVFGTAASEPWMAGIFENTNTFNLADLDLTINELLAQIAAGGFLSSINHPMLVPWEWQALDTGLDQLHCVEVWNDPSWSKNQTANPAALALWTRWLNAGYRMTAIGGSDFHRPAPPPDQEKPAERLGLPRTYVYAEGLSGAAILEGIRNRRAYVSMGPEIAFEAELSGKTLQIGQAIDKAAGQLRIKGTVAASEAPRWARIVKNGDVVAQVQGRGGKLHLAHSEPLQPGQSAWFRFEVVDAYEALAAVTNPIFFGSPATQGGRTYGEFIDPARVASDR